MHCVAAGRQAGEASFTKQSHTLVAATWKDLSHASIPCQWPPLQWWYLPSPDMQNARWHFVSSQRSQAWVYPLLFWQCWATLLIHRAQGLWCPKQVQFPTRALQLQKSLTIAQHHCQWSSLQARQPASSSLWHVGNRLELMTSSCTSCYDYFCLFRAIWWLTPNIKTASLPRNFSPEAWISWFLNVGGR